jgi:hypothetical protein
MNYKDKSQVILTIRSKHTMISAITLGNHSKKNVISTHSDITKEDEEHSNHFPIIVVFCLPHTQEVDYK